MSAPGSHAPAGPGTGQPHGVFRGQGPRAVPGLPARAVLRTRSRSPHSHGFPGCSGVEHPLADGLSSTGPFLFLRCGLCLPCDEHPTPCWPLPQKLFVFLRMFQGIRGRSNPGPARTARSQRDAQAGPEGVLPCLRWCQGEGGLGGCGFRLLTARRGPDCRSRRPGRWRLTSSPAWASACLRARAP